MKNFLFIISLLIILVSCIAKPKTSIKVYSPNSQIEVVFNETKGAITYAIFYKDSILIEPSSLGFLLKNSKSLNGLFSVDNFKITSTNKTWMQIWGERKLIVDHYNQLAVSLQEKVEPFRKMNIVFKVYDDGVGFRYEIPTQENLDSLLI